VTEDPTYPLLERLLRDDAAAWDELVRRYSALMLETARRTFAAYGFSASHHDHEDAVAVVWQNLLARDCERIRSCLGRRNFLPTLYVLVRNRCVDVMRRHKIQAEPISDECPLAAPAEPPPSGDALTPEHGLAALEVLSERERALVQLFYLRERKYREISEITGIPMNSIGPMLQRALAKMRKHLLTGRE